MSTFAEQLVAPPAQPEPRVRSEAWALVRLALPIIGVKVGAQLMHIVDAAFAGRLGGLQQAAVGLGTTFVGAGMMIVIGVVVGLDPIVSQAFGAGRTRYARHALWQGGYVGLLATIPLTAGIVAVGLALEMFGVGAAMADGARTYMWARLPSFPALVAVIALRGYLNAAHRAAPVFWSSVVANIVNFVGDWALMFGVPALGIPSMGIAGLAWATNFALVVQVVMLCVVVRRIAPGPGSERLRAPDRETMRRVAGFGVPIGLQFLAEIGVFSLVGLLISRMGESLMAAHYVSLQLAALTFMVPLGVGMATTVQVGRAVGRGDTPGARRAGFLGLGIGATFMAAMAAVMTVVPDALARVMTSDPAVVAVAVVLIRIAAVFQIVDGIQVVAAHALRGVGITRWVLLVNLVGFWSIAMPIGCLLAYRFQWGPEGLWWGLVIGLLLVAVSLSVKFSMVTRRRVEAVVT